MDSEIPSASNPNRINLPLLMVDRVTFLQKTEAYQAHLQNGLSGRIIAHTLKEYFEIEPTIEEVAIVHILVSILDSSMRSGDLNYWQTVEAPVQYLFSKLTNFSPIVYRRFSFARSYMGALFQRCADRLRPILTIKGQYQDENGIGHCRKYIFESAFLGCLRQFQENFLLDLHLVTDERNRSVDKLRFNRFACAPVASLGDGFKHLDRLVLITQESVRKLQKSQFRFDWTSLTSPSGKNWIKEQLKARGVFEPNWRSDYERGQPVDLNIVRRQMVVRQLIASLDTIQRTEEPQYHDTYNLQGPGRLHTRGGPMSMPKDIRDQFVRPANSRNVIVDLDLKCCHLLLLAEVLGNLVVRDQILSIIDSHDSLWNHIDPTDLSKDIKKPIFYAFAYGALREKVPYLATLDTRNLSSKSITSEIVTACLDSPIISPLIPLRDQWMEQYTLDKILSGKVKSVIHTNALGLKFSLNKALKEIEQSYSNKLSKLIPNHSNRYNVASRLLAHYTQGLEQEIVQTMLAELIYENAVCYQYDGFSIEMPRQAVERRMAEIEDWVVQRFPSARIEWKILEPIAFSATT